MARDPRQESGRLLADVPGDQVFWCCDGRVMRNLTDLEKALDSMSDEAFAHHANEERNDFSIWVRGVIRDETLAKSLEKSVNRSQAAKKVAERINVLEGKLREKPAPKAPRTPAKKAPKKR